MRITSFSIIRDQKNCRKKNTQLIIYCPLGNSQSLKSQSGLYSAIRKRLTTQSKLDLWYTRTQFAQTNGLMMRTCVYIINASNAMPKPYLYTYVRAYVRTRSIANSTRKRTQTHARKLIVAFDAWAISACKRVCVLHVRSKISGCTISTSYVTSMRYVARINHEARGCTASEGRVIYSGNVLNRRRDISNLCRHEPVAMVIGTNFLVLSP